MAKKVSELPVAQIASDTDQYLVVQSAQSRKQTLAQIKTAILDGNVAALAGLTGAADRLAYFTGVGAMALTPLTAVARALLDDTTVAAQRATLGLVLTTSATDTTVGSVLKVGDYGWGAQGNAVPTYTVTPASLANTSPSAIVQALTTDVQATVQSPVSGEEFGGVHIARGIRPAQFGVSGRGATSSLWFRGYSTAAPLLADWLRAAKAGVNSDITSLTGLTTALSVAQGGTGVTTSTGTGANVQAVSPALTGTPTVPTAAIGTNTTQAASMAAIQARILGTVSQSAGVPTGTIVQRGSNANGEFVKFADGTMICQGTNATFAVGVNASVARVITFPDLFINTNYAVTIYGTPDASNDIYGFTQVSTRLTSGVTATFRNGATAQNVINTTWSATGRWF